MAMLGMQTDMQYHCLPGYCSTRELNLNASYGILPFNNVENIPKKGSCYNGSLAPPYPDQYLAYKEKMKQTMLQHEAIFKDQIHELHRLYNRQRELMYEMKMIKFYGHHLQSPTSQSNQISPGTSFKYSQQMCRVSTLPWMIPAYGHSFGHRPENNQSHLNHVEGQIPKAGCGTVQTEGLEEKPELVESKFKKVGKKILDLELPAYEYVDSEQDDPSAWETVPLEGPSYPRRSINEDVQKNNVEMSHEIQDTVAIQNDKISRASFSMRTMCFADLNEPVMLEDEIDPKSINFPRTVADHGEIPCNDLSRENNSDFQIQLKETLKDTQARENPEAFSNVLHLEKSGHRQGFSSGNDEAGQSSSDLNASPERARAETFSTSSKDDEIEQAHEVSISRLNLKRKRNLFGFESCPGQDAAEHKHTSSELIHEDDVINGDSSLVSSWRNQVCDVLRVPIAVQALPCSDSPSRLNGISTLRIPQIDGGKSFLDINVEPKTSSAQSSFSSESDANEKHLKDSRDLNLAGIIDLNCTSPSSSDAAAYTTWLTNGGEKLKDLTNLTGLAETNKKRAVDCNFSDETGEQLSTNELVLGNNLVKKSSGFGFHVDLNSSVKEEELSQLPSLSSQIDLQAPASPENEERTPPREESDENQLKTPRIPSKQKNSDLLENFIRVAAEAIVSMSSFKAQNDNENAGTEPSEAAESSCLFWFSQLASSAIDDPNSEFGVALSCKNFDTYTEYPSDGIDYFEAMTLKLEETKVEGFSCETNVEMEEMTCAPSSPSQPRRGRSKRGRQLRNDFQSEILPSLASLSRYEVTEDLQVIGGLIEAVRQSTEARTGTNGRTRGRKRRSSISSFKAENSLCTQLNQQNKHGECRNEEWNLVGWGKTTRRRRGQRYPASNPRIISGQV